MARSVGLLFTLCETASFSRGSPSQRRTGGLPGCAAAYTGFGEARQGACPPDGRPAPGGDAHAVTDSSDSLRKRLDGRANPAATLAARGEHHHSEDVVVPTPLEILLDPISLVVMAIYATLIALETAFPARRLP